MSVLVVTHDAHIARLFERLFRGHETLSASSHNSALSVLLQRQVDVVVTTHKLDAGPHGDDVLAAAAMLQPTCARVLLVSTPADHSLTLVSQGLIDQCLSPPFDSALVSQIEAMGRQATSRRKQGAKE